LGFVVGMVGGGIITEFLGWRWVMFVNVPVALAVFLLAPLAVPESRGTGVPRSLDLTGAATATLGLVFLIYAVSKVPANGWASPATIGLGAAGALILTRFVAVESRSEAPLVPLGVLRERAVVVPNAAITLQSMIGMAWLYALTLYFQDVLGYGPLTAGLLFVPMTLSAVLGAHVAGRLVTIFGVKPTAAGALVLVAAGLLLMASMSEAGALPFVLSGMVVGEFGFMLSNVPLTIAATGGVSEDERGLASGLLNTSMQLGNAIGLAVLATVAAAVASSSEAGGGEAFVGGLRWGLLLCVVIVVIALSVVLLGLSNDTARQKSSA